MINLEVPLPIATAFREYTKQVQDSEERTKKMSVLAYFHATLILRKKQIQLNFSIFFTLTEAKIFCEYILSIEG